MRKEQFCVDFYVFDVGKTGSSQGVQATDFSFDFSEKLHVDTQIQIEKLSRRENHEKIKPKFVKTQIKSEAILQKEKKIPKTFNEFKNHNDKFGDWRDCSKL